MRKSHVFAVAAALVFAAGAAQAQATNICDAGNATVGTSGATSGTCIVTQALSVTVPTVANLSSTAIATVTAGSVEYNAGYIDFVGTTINMKANFPYTLTATAGTLTNLVNTRLMIGTSASPTTDMSVARTIASGAASGAVTPIQTYHRVLLSWATDLAGQNKSATITYTLTTP